MVRKNVSRSEAYIEGDSCKGNCHSCHVNVTLACVIWHLSLTFMYIIMLQAIALSTVIIFWTYLRVSLDALLSSLPRPRHIPIILLHQWPKYLRVLRGVLCCVLCCVYIVRPTVLLYVYHIIYCTVYHAVYPAYKNKKLISNTLLSRTGIQKEKGMKITRW